ncbi:MAG: CBS domain-containing protein [Acidobacteria bacterium]|nr:CBS domain-containing protein [Acidobacteriota bacterium]
MSKPVMVVREDTTLEEIARMMLDNNIGCVPVVDTTGKISGVITESDFAAKDKGLPFSTFRAPQLLGRWMSQEGVERIYDAARSMTAKEIMNRRVATVTEDQSAQDVVELMLKFDVNRIPVVREGVPVGMVSRHDLLRLMVREMRGEESK